jgi:HlyD family secretion protein
MKRFSVAYFGTVFVVAVVIIAIGAVGVSWYVLGRAAPSLGTYVVARGNVVSSIDLPGTVSSSNSVDLSFQESGQIAAVYVKEGEEVTSGEALASLDDSAQQTALDQEQAALTAAKAKLDELQSGTRPEVIAIDENAVGDATASLAATVGNAYTSANDAVENQTDVMFDNPQVEPVFLPNSNNNQLVIDLEEKRKDVIEPALNNWLAALNAPGATASSTVSFADTGLSQIKDYLDSVALTVNGAMASINISAAQLAALKINVATARSEVAGAISSLTGAESALKAAQSQLALDKAGATSQDIEAQKAVVLQAQAAIDNAQLTINHATIAAPFSGTVRNVIAQKGMVVSPNVPVISIINDQMMKIDAYASENNVAKIQLNAVANVTLDAYGDSVKFPAKVAAVDTAETMSSGSSAYHITLYFMVPDSRIRAGMSGDVFIVATEHDNVPEVPSRLILRSGGDDFVLIDDGGKGVKRLITVGLTGDDGMVEIVSGLNVGEKISDF